MNRSGRVEIRKTFSKKEDGSCDIKEKKKPER